MLRFMLTLSSGIIDFFCRVFVKTAGVFAHTVYLRKKGCFHGRMDIDSELIGRYIRKSYHNILGTTALSGASLILNKKECGGQSQP
jgi:hypothetical protein